MKRIAFVNPGTDPQYAVTEPLNLGFLSSYIEKNLPDVTIKIIDQLAGDDVYEKIRKFSPDIVAITGVTPLITHTYTIADYCRQRGCLTIIGGVHASILPEEALLHADIVIKGEGEKALVKIVQDNIKSGIVEGDPISNLDEIPPAARHLMNMEFYVNARRRLSSSFLNFVPINGRVAAMLTSRGCPFDCCFCHNSWKNLPYRFNSPERIIQEIEELVKQYKITSVFFIEDNFFVNKPRVRRICDMILKRGITITWGANSRVDNIDPELFELAKKAGCRQITFGFESGSQKILDLLHKQSTVEQNIRAVQICNDLGIGVNGTVMIGNPTETIDDIQKTKSFIEHANINNGIGICLTTPYPGTKLWDWCKKKNRIPPSFLWSDFNYQMIPIKITDFSTEELLGLYSELKEIAALKWQGTLSLTYFLSHTNPAQIMRILKSPIKIMKNIKRLRL